MPSTQTKCELEKRFLLAAEQKDMNVVEECLRMGVNPNSRKTDRVTALHIAAERGDTELGNRLIQQKGLNLNPFTIHGYTPLIIATNSRRDEFVKFLLENGANPNIPERFGKTALHHAAFMDCLTIADILIDHGAEIDVVDVFCHSPLSISVVERNFLPMAKLLVERGANVNLFRCELVLHIFLEACLSCSNETQLDVVIFLLDNGTDPNTLDTQTNRNAFHYFAINNYLPLARLLTSRGTNPNHADRFKLTPLKLAKQHNNVDAVEYLESVVYVQKV